MSNSYLSNDTRAVITGGVSVPQFESPTRIQTNVLAWSERKLLNWICSKTPRALNPDHFTMLGLVGAACTAVGFALASLRPSFFLFAAFGLFANWLGDSLDGSLARYRRIERPRYGYYLDHMADVLNTSLIFVGIGLSPYVRSDVASFALVGCLLITSQVLAANHVEGRFHLGFVRFGPTELRIVLIAFALVMYFHDPVFVNILSTSITTYTIFVGILGFIFLGVFLHDFITLERRLAKAEPRPEYRRGASDIS